MCSLTLIVEIASCSIKETTQKLSPNLTIGERLNERIKLPVHALTGNLQDVQQRKHWSMLYDIEIF